MIRYFLIDQGKSLYCYNKNLGSGAAAGLNMRRVPVYQTPTTPLSAYRQVDGVTNDRVYTRPDFTIWIEGVAPSLSWTQVEPGRWYAESGHLKVYVQSFDDKAWRISAEVKLYGTKTDFRVVIPTNATVIAERMRERYPLFVNRSNGQVTVTVIGKGGDTSHRLGWLCDGHVNITVPPGAAAGYDSEISEASQYPTPNEASSIVRGVDIVIGDTAMLAPTICLTRTPFSPLFDASVEVKVSTEKMLLEFFEDKVLHSSSAASGWPLFGDFPEQESSKARCNNCGHYFHPTALLRASVRASSDEYRTRWWNIARASADFVRDMCWYSGQQAHGKGLTPWSSPVGYLGHWVDSEFLLMCWILYGDIFAKQRWDDWAATAIGASQPAGSIRETQVPVRMFRVAYAFTGNSAWNTKANTFEGLVLTKYLSDPTDLCLWHPEALKERIYPNDTIKYGWWNLRVSPGRPITIAKASPNYPALLPVFPNTGPIGEMAGLLQLHNADERVYTTKASGPGLSNASSLTVYLDVARQSDLVLNTKLVRQIGGDYHSLAIDVFNPSNTRVAGGTYNLNTEPDYYDIYGNQIKKIDLTVSSAVVGIWRVEFRCFAIGVYKWISQWPETVDVPTTGLLWQGYRLGPT